MVRAQARCCSFRLGLGHACLFAMPGEAAGARCNLIPLFIIFCTTQPAGGWRCSVLEMQRAVMLVYGQTAMQALWMPPDLRCLEMWSVHRCVGVPAAMIIFVAQVCPAQLHHAAMYCWC